MGGAQWGMIAASLSEREVSETLGRPSVVLDTTGATSGSRPGSESKGYSSHIGGVGRVVIVEADDFGLLHAFNEAIRRARQEGVLTSTSLRANGHAYEHAIREVLPACPGMGMGIHLCLNEAAPIAPRDRVPLLVRRGGMLRPGYLWLLQLVRVPAGLEQIEIEFRAQIEKVLGDGLSFDHLNSHHHVHMIPEIFAITCRLAREYRIPCVRLAREPAYWGPGLTNRVEPLVNTNYAKHLLLNRFSRRNAVLAAESGVITTEGFVGVKYTGHMNIGRVAAGLAGLDCGSVEVLLHPAIGPDPRDAAFTSPFYRRYIPARSRAIEFETLISKGLADVFRDGGWTGVTFASVAERARAGGSGAVPGKGGSCRAIPVGNPPWVSAAHDDARTFAQIVVERVRPGQRVLDLGTGTGILAIALARAGVGVVATDISAAAVRTALDNAGRNGVRFECYQSDLLDSVTGRFDVIAFNPPYNVRPDTFVSNVAKNLVRRIPWVQRNCGRVMPRAVLRFHQSLVRRIAEKAPSCLNPGGYVILHAFPSEVEALREVLPAGFEVQVVDHPALRPYGTCGMVISPAG